MNATAILRLTRTLSGVIPPGAAQRGCALRSFSASTSRLGNENTTNANASASASNQIGVAALVGLGAAVAVGSSSTTSFSESKDETPVETPVETQAEAATPDDNSKDTPPPPPRNPLWPSGCREEDIDAFIDQVMKDRSFNIAQLPDSIERVLYKSTAKLVLSTFFYMVSNAHGTELFGHQVVLQKKEGAAGSSVKLDWNTASSTKVDPKVLEEIADKMLANSAVNLRLVPDALERVLYTNCMRLVFRILDILAASFQLQVCGHALVMDVLPSVLVPDTHDTSRLTSPLTSNIDLGKVRELARLHAGIVPEDRSELSLWQRWFIREEFLAQLHESVYGLVLAIADNVLAHTQITLLSDTITLDLVPCPPTTDETKEEGEAGSSNGQGGSGFDARSFVLGCGVGLTAAAAVLAAGQR